MSVRPITRGILLAAAIAAGAVAQQNPTIVYSYVLQSDQNVIPLQPGGFVFFPPTLTTVTAQGSLNIANAGTGPAVIRSISKTGSNAFRLTGLPLFPATVSAGQTLPVQIFYQPTAVSADAGQIAIAFDGGTTVTINLQGSGTAAGFVYQIVSDPPVTVPPGGTIPFPGTNVGETASVSIRVTNAGNAPGTISSINAAPQAFQLSNVPPLPLTLALNTSLTFTVTFAPTQPETLTGNLTINSDILRLSGAGLGTRLVFSYVVGGNTITIGPSNNSVVFTPVMISQSSQLTFRTRNTGTVPAIISNIGITQPNSPFAVSGLPPPPVSLAPNAEFGITITFTPTTLGFANGTLQLDTTTVPLIGSGSQPPQLPSYTIVGPSGTAAPMSQPRVGLSLASPYPIAIAGTLTLGVSSNLQPDPAVQFSTGGRTVSFIIPANNTDALFGSQGNRVGLQTGTVASALTLTPTFATQAGNVDLTPAAPPTLQFSVAPAAPTLISAQVTNQTANSFVLNVTGFTTSRTLTAWNLQLTPAPGVTLSTSQFKIDIQQIASLWFQRPASQPFGGLFTMTMPLTFQGTASEGQSLISSIASVTVTMDNELGTSNSIQARVQ